jgi:hypothetical protein
MSIINTSRATTREPKNVNTKNQEDAALESVLRLFIRWVSAAETEDDIQSSLDAFSQLVRLRKGDELTPQQKFVMRSVSPEVI